ncbi:MAG: (d)CMP kinase [Betaproteobacteria bacterium]|nr:(d)CMP kinase [Betaproteobacteria bacterium]
MGAAAPVIAIDGPSASGKGTVARLVARALGFHYLNSGSLYRLVALSALRSGVSWEDEPRLAELAASLDAGFCDERIIWHNKDVTGDISSESVAAGASQVAALPAVRSALLKRQRGFRQPPGLVAEGRDMGSVVFPRAELKIFLTASAAERAERRYKQLKEKGITATLRILLQDLRERDARDAARSVAPLKQGPDARLLDTTAMSAKDAAERILAWYRGADR